MAFGNLNERGQGRLGGVRPKPSQPVLPAPPAQPNALKPNIATETPLKPNKLPRVNPNAAPDPTTGKLPPRFANMVTGGMTEAQARQKWARSLTNRGKIGPGAGGGATTPPGVSPPPVTPGGGVGTPPVPGGPVSNPFVPSPSPAPGTPVYGGYGGGQGGGYGGGQGGGYPGMPQIGPGSPIMPGGQDFRDPMSSFLSAVPLMNLNASKQIDSAMSQAGFGGNRWSTSAMNTAADIGSQNSLAQNAMFTSALTDYANQQENRALQASGMGMQLGGMFDQQAQDRVKLPFQVGAYEQGRADDLSKQYYDDYEKQKLGWLPMMLSAASGQSGGSAGTLVPVPGQPSKPGIVDYASILAQLFG